MRQLGELNRNKDKFKEQNVEVIAIFREESKGTDGLKIIKDKTKVDFTLALDTPVKATSAYSPGNKVFTNYVIDKGGVIRGIIPGDLRNRAKSKELLDIIASLGEESKPSAGDDKAAVERAVLDYVEGIYDVKPELIKRGVHPDLKKFGFWRPGNEEAFKDGSAMTFDQLVKLAANYNKDGSRVPEDAPKEVFVLDVMDKIASAKLNASWGTDYFHLVKEDGQWKILQVVWQSPTRK